MFPHRVAFTAVLAGVVIATTVVAGTASSVADTSAVSAGSGGGSVQPNNGAVPGTVTAVIKTIGVGGSPQGVAINDSDDTVYVTNRNSNSVSVINGRTGEVIDTITVGTGPVEVAVNQADDTVYVTNSNSNNVSVINGRTGLRTDDTITVGSFPYAVAVNQADDTVYVTNSNSGSVSVINGRTGLRTDDTITVGGFPYGVAVNQADDTVYVTNYNTNNVSVINGRTGLRTDDTITVGTGPWGVAVDDSGINRGVVYVTRAVVSGNVSVLAQVSPSITPSLSPSGSVVTVRLDVPQVGYDVDDSTITSVFFDDTEATGLTAGDGDTWTVTAPAGSGTVPVTVLLNGGLTASAGTFTYGSPTPPTPPVVFPPSAPLAVTATAGDASAEVAWTAPQSSGSFPISSYQAVAAPGGQSCLVAAPALTCTITGLVPGTTYTVTVRALNGAGWGPYSQPSAPFTPPSNRSIVITGSRVADDPRRVQAQGTTTGLVGATVTPRVKLAGQTEYTTGSGTRTVDAQGEFTWQRNTSKKVYVYFVATDGVRSKRVIINAR